MKKQSFFFGAVLLTASSVISKIIGAIYKIPLTNLLGPQGLGIYYIIFPVYAFLITFVSTSYTLSISRMVSSEIGGGSLYMARKTLYASLFLLTIVGAVLASILIVASRVIADLQGVENAYICYLAIAPAIVMVAMSSSFKGYFQGLQNMTPSAVSQVVEQIVKLAVGFTLATILSRHGALKATMGAIIGISVSEAVTLIFFVIWFFVHKARNPATKSQNEKANIFVLSSKVMKTTLPFLLSSIITPLSLMIDSFLIVNILRNAGFDKYFATALLGLNSGVVNTLVNLPTTLSSSICVTIIPYITYALSKGDFNTISKRSLLAFKVTTIISIPCTIVFLLFGGQVISLLYSSGMSSAESTLSVSLLSIASFNVLYISLLQITTALLQAISKAYIPVISLSLSLAVKVLLEVLLVSIVPLNIFGAIISAGASYALSSIINLIYLRKHININFSPYRIVIAPILSSGAMVGAITLTFIILKGLVPSSIATLSAFFGGAVVYMLMIFITKVFEKDEFEKLFKRRKIKLAT